MSEEQEEEYRKALNEILDKDTRIREEVSKEFKDSPKIQKNVEERFVGAEKKIFSSMRHYVFEDKKKAKRDLLKAKDRLEEALLFAWKEKAIYVQELTNNSIDGFVKRIADLDLFHKLDVFNELISSAKEMERNEAIENYRQALSMKKNLWRDIDLVKKKSSFEYFYRIALPIVIVSITAGIAIYQLTKQMELMVLTIFFSLVISIGLFSFIRGKLGKESVALFACVFVIILLVASTVGIDIDFVILLSGVSTFAGMLSAVISLKSLRKIAKESSENLSS